jgi:hypothetical protein
MTLGRYQMSDTLFRALQETLLKEALKKIRVDVWWGYWTPAQRRRKICEFKNLHLQKDPSQTMSEKCIQRERVQWQTSML